MGPINDAISHYQQIIGAYDKQLWERSVELAVLKGLKNATRKTAKVNPDLIDVDLVRGSTFSKPKPEHGWLGVSWRAVPRVLFLPLYYKWWKKSTGVSVYALLTFLYVMQVMTFSLYVLDTGGYHLDTESLSLAHMLTPCIMIFVLALVHTQIMATYVSLKKSRNTREMVDCKPETDAPQQSGSELESIGSRDTGIDLNPDPDVSDAVVHRTVGKPSSVHRRRSRSSQPPPAQHSDAVDQCNDTLRIDADDEEDDPSSVGKIPVSASAARRQTARSASIDKTVEWLLTQTGGTRQEHCNDCNVNTGPTTTAALGTGITNGLNEAVGLSSPVGVISSPLADRSGAGRSVGFERRCTVAVSSPNLYEMDCREMELTGNSHDALSASVGLRQRLLNQRSPGIDRPTDLLPSPALEDGVSEVSSNRRRHLVTQDSRQTLLSVGVSSGDSEAGASNRRRSKAKQRSNLASVTSSRDGRRTPSLCERRSSADVATSEWEYNMNTDMTSTPSGSGSDLSENDAIVPDLPRHVPQNVSCTVKESSSLPSDRVSCMMWESSEAHKVELTVLDMGWKIIERVDKLMCEESCSYFVLGLCMSVVFMFLPVAYRLYHTKDQLDSLDYQAFEGLETILRLAFGQNWRQSAVIINGLIQRFCLSVMLFFLLTVAERTFQQRLLYAKNFCYLTSSRRAKKYNLPHFRLNKVRTIRSWLSLRSFLKRRGPQQSVENIVSAAFLVSIVLVSILCIELLQDSGSFLDHLGNWELVVWCMALGVFLMRFITLGTNINKKYRNFSVLITEQINLYLHMEQKPHKKDELMIANSVLKLAENLLKELESPFRVSGLSANPLLYNITKVVVLSAFSAVLTELLGFKLKLYKIKIRA